MNQSDAEDCTRLASALQQQGRLEEAIVLYRKARDLTPDVAEINYNLAQAVQHSGQIDAAIDGYRRAVAGRPDYAKAWNNLAGALFERGHTDEAIEAYHKAIAAQPAFADAYFNLGTALHKIDHLAEAIEAFQQALRLRPNFPEAANHLGTALGAAGRTEEAIAQFQRAIALRTGFAEAHNNLANVLLDEDRVEEAEAIYRQAIALRADYPDAWNNLGNAMQRQGRFDEAIGAFQKVRESAPQHAASQFNLAWTLLLQGDFERGWALHDARLELEAERHGRRFSQPLWDGSPLNGRRILLHAEQGLGDTIQFVRYVQWVATLCGTIILETQPRLRRLLQTLSGVAQLVSRGEPLPEFDVHCPLMSLPRRHRTMPDTIPADVPYLHAEPSLAARWRERIPPDKLNIGLIWAGNPKPKHRSAPLHMFSELAGVPRVRFHSLQKGTPAQDLRSGVAGLEIIDWEPHLLDFADTAAAVHNLDLIISVDTAVAHLAGALAKPVWVLLQSIPDWRWMLGRADSPWYPTMQLFRQARRGDWPSAMHRVFLELNSLSRLDISP